MVQGMLVCLGLAFPSFFYMHMRNFLTFLLAALLFVGACSFKIACELGHVPSEGNMHLTGLRANLKALPLS